MATVTQKSGSVLRAVRFEFRAPAYAQRVAVAGDFNSWNLYKNLMQKNPSGIWEATVNLAPGRYQYKIVINDKEWLMDPKAQAQVPNRYGSTNSVLEVK